MNDQTTEGTKLGRVLARLESPGLSERKTRVLNAVLLVILVVFAAGWTVALSGAAGADAPLELGSRITENPLSRDAAPPIAFLLDRLVREAATEGPWRGRSGAVRVLVPDPGDTLALADTLGLDSLPPMARLEVRPAVGPGGQREAGGASDADVDEPGAWNVLVRVQDQVKELTDLSVLTPVSVEALEGGRIGSYLVGEWPSRAERPANLRTEAYDAPRGLIAVTQDNRDLQVSDHLTLGDFLTKGQEDVWPKYVVIVPRLLDKLELTFQELEEMGHPVENVGVISGFRTPQYNAHGGNTSGRGSFSRHMYGDAMDFYIDNDGDGRMDDLTGDGRVNIADARVVGQAAERVEEEYPEYIGGIGVYDPTSAHSGFVHVDVRGYRARW